MILFFILFYFAGLLSIKLFSLLSFSLSLLLFILFLFNWCVVGGGGDVTMDSLSMDKRVDFALFGKRRLLVGSIPKMDNLIHNLLICMIV